MIVITLLWLVVVAFVFSQSLYFVVNVLAAGLLYSRPGQVVTADAAVDPRPIHVLMPVYNERYDVLVDTLAGLYESDYPLDLVTVYLIYERDDAMLAGYLDRLKERAMDEGWNVAYVPVNRTALAHHVGVGWTPLASSMVPRTKAAALTYAFITLSFAGDDVITVFDSDTRVPADLFRLAIAGLEEYDVVQAKQTVRNLDDGWLPRLEAMGIAAWSTLVYTHTSRGPYQLLGKGYFLTARSLNELHEWDVDAVTEDLSLGLAASVRGFSLGIVDRYVQDLCPADGGDWIRQKRRWVRGPYDHLLSESLGWRARLRFWTFTVANQVVSLTNLVGVPVGIAVFVLSVAGYPFGFPWWFSLLVGFNLLCWAYYSAMSYLTAREAIVFDSAAQRRRYFLLVNPLTQLVYATVWAIPILLAVFDLVRGRRRPFEVTPK